MRPEQIAPENARCPKHPARLRPASMRPEQIAPENKVEGRRAVARQVASMRPEQIAPENLTRPRRMMASMRCFNEAGANCSGKPRADHLTV